MYEDCPEADVSAARRVCTIRPRKLPPRYRSYRVPPPPSRSLTASHPSKPGRTSISLSSLCLDWCLSSPRAEDFNESCDQKRMIANQPSQHHNPSSDGFNLPLDAKWSTDHHFFQRWMRTGQLQYRQSFPYFKTSINLIHAINRSTHVPMPRKADSDGVVLQRLLNATCHRSFLEWRNGFHQVNAMWPTGLTCSCQPSPMSHTVSEAEVSG